MATATVTATATTVATPIRQRQPSRCSFCNQGGHNIKGCNNIDLLHFEKDVLIARFDFLHIPGEFEEFLVREFESNPNMCHALSVKRCHVLTRTRDRSSICDALYNYYMQDQSRIYRESLPQNRNVYKNSLRNDIYSINRFIEQQNPNWILGPNQIPFPNQIPIIPYNLSRINLTDVFDVEDNSDDDDTSFINRIISSLPPAPTQIHKFPIKKIIDLSPSETTIECPICYEEIAHTNTITLQCNKAHSFCAPCILNQLNVSNKKPPCCALCREDMKTFCIRSQEVETNINQKII